MNANRRDFLKASFAAGAAAVRPGAVCSAGPPTVSPDATGVLVDLTKCNGCRRCEAACQEQRGLTPPSPEELTDRSVFDRKRPLDPQHYTVVNEHRLQGLHGDRLPIYVKLNCLHCSDPACVSACLVGALRKHPMGPVVYDPYKCMGCRYCMVACPFQIPTYEYDNAFTPRMRKCTFCFDRAQTGGGQVPACVEACPKECLTFGKRSELLERAHDRIREQPDVYVDHVHGEHEGGGTAWLYLSPVPFEQLGLPMLAAEAAPRLSEAIQHGVFTYFMPPIAWCCILGLAMWLTRESDEERPTRKTAAVGSNAAGALSGAVEEGCIPSCPH